MECPRRAENPGPWKYDKTDKWQDRPSLASEGALGPSCSYCGSLKPEVFMEKIRAGWHIGGSDKSYKWYLEEPLPDAEREAREAEWKLRHPTYPFPAYLRHAHTVAKFYTPHLDRAQSEEFMQLWRDGKLNHSMYVRPWLPALPDEGR